MSGVKTSSKVPTFLHLILLILHFLFPCIPCYWFKEQGSWIFCRTLLEWNKLSRMVHFKILISLFFWCCLEWHLIFLFFVVVPRSQPKQLDGSLLLAASKLNASARGGCLRLSSPGAERVYMYNRDRQGFRISVTWPSCSQGLWKELSAALRSKAAGVMLWNKSFETWNIRTSPWNLFLNACTVLESNTRTVLKSKFSEVAFVTTSLFLTWMLSTRKKKRNWLKC